MIKKLKNRTGSARDIFKSPSGQIGNLIFQKNGSIRLKRPRTAVKRSKKI